LPASEGIAVTANVGSVLFDPLHGTSSPTATFTLIAASGRSIEHVVNLLGRVRSCSPQGSVPGYAVC
jgi:type IV fimbrial biogenesis protein FimT